MPDFIGLFLCLRKRELEQKVWELWLAQLPPLPWDNVVPFNEMLEQVKQIKPQEEGPQNGAYVDQVFL